MSGCFFVRTCYSKVQREFLDYVHCGDMLLRGKKLLVQFQFYLPFNLRLSFNSHDKNVSVK